MHVLKRDIILLLPQPTHSLPAPISCPDFYLVIPVTHPSAQGSEPLNAVPNPAVQHEISHTSVPHGHQLADLHHSSSGQ